MHILPFITCFFYHSLSFIICSIPSFITIGNLGAFITIYSIKYISCIAFITNYSIYYKGNLCMNAKVEASEHSEVIILMLKPQEERKPN